MLLERSVVQRTLHITCPVMLETPRGWDGSAQRAAMVRPRTAHERQAGPTLGMVGQTPAESNPASWSLRGEAGQAAGADPSIAARRCQELGTGDARPERIRGRVHALLVARLELVRGRMARLAPRHLLNTTEIRAPLLPCATVTTAGEHANPAMAHDEVGRRIE